MKTTRAQILLAAALMGEGGSIRARPRSGGWDSSRFNERMKNDAQNFQNTSASRAEAD
jgi:hypothetical protein